MNVEPRTRTRVTATPLYPGIIMSEPGAPVNVYGPEPEHVLKALEHDQSWAGARVRQVRERCWYDGAGNERWTFETTLTEYQLYVGEVFNAKGVRALPNPDQYAVLLDNMHGNRWDRVVRTRRGNWHPLEVNDVVVPAAPEGTKP